MNQLQTFENELFKVSAKTEGEQILFDVEQVAKSLGITDNKKGTQYVRWSRVNSYLPTDSPQVAKGDLIPESLVYKLAFKAQNEVAEKFQDWLAIEVIPSIRKHGAYMTPETIEDALLNPDTLIKLATNLKDEQEKRKLLESENKELKPKATYHDLVLQSNTLLKITDIAKDLGMGAPTLNKKLHELGVQYKKGHRWYLYHKYQDKGYTQSKTYAVSAEESKDHMYWTQEGKKFIFDLLEEKEGIVPVTKVKELV